MFSFSRSVQFGCFIQSFIDPFQSGKENQHLITAALPCGYENDPIHCALRVVQETDRRDPELRKKRVQKSGLAAAENTHPKERGDRKRNNDRCKIQHLVYAHTPNRLIDEQGKPQRHSDLQRYNEYDEFQSVHDRIIDVAARRDIFKNICEISEADKLYLVGTEKVIVGERVSQGIYDRQQYKDTQQGECRKKHQIGSDRSPDRIMHRFYFCPFCDEHIFQNECAEQENEHTDDDHAYEYHVSPFSRYLS